MKKSSDTIGNQTRDVPVCSEVVKKIILSLNVRKYKAQLRMGLKFLRILSSNGDEVAEFTKILFHVIW
jgi:hypothetical protein